MLGAILIGLSGLKAYSRGLQKVSNNVANLNTIGFKTSTVEFTDLFGGSGRGGLSYTAGEGGGHGVDITSSRLNLSQGELRQTGNALDLAVDGTGFLVLQKDGQTSYARTGSFEVGNAGYILLAGTEYRLSALDGTNRPTAVTVDGARTNPPKATTTIAFSDNISSSETSYSIGDIKVYDASGTEHVWQVKFSRETASQPNWNVTVTDDKSKTIGTQTLNFVSGAPDPAAAQLEFTDADAALTVKLDFSQGVTSFSSGSISTLRKSSSDGHATGTLSTVTINDLGHVELSYSNNEKADLGAIAIADFRDPQSLEQRTGGLFVDKGEGDRQLLASGDPRVGKVVSKKLEASNVDLSGEFGDLILIQRGFQASSQVVSVSNDMIQQLFGIRGQ